MGIVTLGGMGRSSIGTEETEKVHHLPSILFLFAVFYLISDSISCSGLGVGLLGL